MNLPTSFEDTMRGLLGDGYDHFRQALFDEPAVSIRLNPTKRAVTTAYESVPWATDGYYLPSRPSFTFDPLLHGGCYYVQEASSMFVEQAIKQHLHQAHVALDLCAAPGGKSTLLRSLLPDDCVLVSNEVMRPRAQVLAENITKWGHPHCVVTSNFPAHFTPLEELFDLILVDAPCSGEGMFRKDPVAVSEWSPENVATCWQRQRDILTDIWPTLRPGGLLIYSTCTFNTEEDEENVRWMMHELGAELLPIHTETAWAITPSLVADVPHAYRFLPGRTRGEGFFLAVLRKSGSIEAGEFFHDTASRKHKPSAKKTKGRQSSIMLPPWNNKGEAPWIQSPECYTYKTEGDNVIALPADMESLVDTLSARLHLIHYGIPLATFKGRDAIPAHALAMSTALNSAAFTTCELPYNEALRYLHGETITLPVDLPRGYVVVTYQNTPLGFVKHLGNRANNLYPNEWRIRSSYFPDTETKIV